MNAFRDIDSLLRVISREKDLIRFLFTGRKAPSLRYEQAVENFLSSDERRINLLLDHGVVRLSDGVLTLDEPWLRFFEEVLEVNEEINVQAVAQHIDALSCNIELWLTATTDPQRFRYLGEILRILRSIAQVTHRGVIDLKRNIDGTYKNERDYALKRKRLEILDRKRADIALLIKEAERVMDERYPNFFSAAMDAHLKEATLEFRASLTESYHSLLELDRQIIRYLNKIEAERKLVEKLRRLKYLKDQLVWEQSTDVLFCLQTHRSAFLEKRPWFNMLPSLDKLTGTADGIAALKDAHIALKRPVAKRKTDPTPLSEEELRPRTLIRDILNTHELRSAFLGGSQDLMTFIIRYRFSVEMGEDARLTLFCRLAAEFSDEFRISDEYAETGDYRYPLIYPR